MQSIVTADEAQATESDVSNRLHLRSTYQKVVDARKRPIRGLWVRNGRYYARIAVEDTDTGQKHVRRVPLEKAETVAQAQAELRRLMTKREDKNLPILKRSPRFDLYADQYLKHHRAVKDGKRPRTLDTEEVHLDSWKAHLGQTRLNHVNRMVINAYIAKRQTEGVSGRTVNLAVTILRNVLNHAIDEGWLKTLPTENLRPLKWKARKRELVSLPEIKKLCEEAIKVSKNGSLFSDYVLLMAYCGARKSETLRLKWDDVDWKNRQLTVGADGLAKNHEQRVVDFNTDLEKHLKHMETGRQPDSTWLFPSPQRGKKDVAAKTFVETMRLARVDARMPKFGFHDCRHHFISQCVMCGIDFMTIARWVGHKDGGVLIGKVYGHLADEHRKRQAQKLVFENKTINQSA